jgi:hypothetical protein
MHDPKIRLPSYLNVTIEYTQELSSMFGSKSKLRRQMNSRRRDTGKAKKDYASLFWHFKFYTVRSIKLPKPKLYCTLYSSVGIVTAGVRFSVRAGYFYLLYSGRTGSGAYPGICPVVPWALSAGVRREKLTTLLHLVPRSRMEKLYFQCPIRLHGMVLNYLNTWKIWTYVLSGHIKRDSQ